MRPQCPHLRQQKTDSQSVAAPAQRQRGPPPQQQGQTHPQQQHQGRQTHQQQTAPDYRPQYAPPTQGAPAQQQGAGRGGQPQAHGGAYAMDAGQVEDRSVI